MIETVESIIDWSKKAFPDATMTGQQDKFKEEKDEWNASNCSDIAELADMFIVACSIARFDTVEAMFCMERVAHELYHSTFATQDLERAINNKMRVNRARSWEKRDGQYKHKG